MKSRRYATVSNVEVRLAISAASVRDILRSIGQCAEWNRDNVEEVGSPQYADSAMIAEVLCRAANEINLRNKEHWRTE
jgi:hypothetical protein